VNRRLWTPTQLPRTSNVWWWDASFAPSLTFGSGAAVTGWRDRLRGAVLATVGTAPVLAHDSRGARIVFDATGGFVSAASSGTLTDLYSMTVWAVATLSTSVGSTFYNRLVSYFGVTGGTDYATDASYIPVLLYNVADALRSFRTGDRAFAAPITRGVPFLASSRLIQESQQTYAVSVNGKRGAPESLSSAAMTSGGRFGIGTRGDAFDSFATSDPWVGDIREVIIYSGRVTPQLEQRVEGYLAAKWNIALASGHPYAFAPPTIGPRMNAAGVAFRRLVPSSTTSNTGWTPSSGTAHAALAADDALYVRALTNGATLRVGLGQGEEQAAGYLATPNPRLPIIR
jgi:hypothetical protein